MKFFAGLLVFVVVFAAVGVGMHYSMYQKPGIFIWSVTQDPGEGGFLERTTFALAGTVEEKEVSADVGGSTETNKPEEVLEAAPAPEPAEVTEQEEEKSEISLFDGKELGQWEKTQFGGEGDVFVNEDGNLEFGFGAILTGVHWGGEVPATSNFEITLDAMKIDGNDFFCALTFPVKDSHATFVIGGWGGGVVGISSVDDLDASENETMNIEGFESDKWFKIRVLVTDEKLQAWIDEDEKVNLDLEGRKISLRPGDIELCVPIGIASFQTRAQFRNITWRNLPSEE